MLNYNQQEQRIQEIGTRKVYCFDLGSQNIDEKTVASFGSEWLKFDAFTAEEIKNAGDQYFDIVDAKMLNKESVVLDLGCGSGRWTKYMANQAGFIEAVDPSEAVFRAASIYNSLENVRFTQASIETLPFDNDSFDFVISLGVLHHIPDTEKALQALLKKLKVGGYALIYLYYALDNRGFFYRSLFKVSSVFRFLISKLPAKIKHFVCDLIALLIYMPLIFISKLIKWMVSGDFYQKFPLSYYIDKSWNIVRNDALDRFGTPLEQRFTKVQIHQMLENSGMKDILFSEGFPYWHVVAKKK